MHRLNLLDEVNYSFTNLLNLVWPLFAMLTM